MNSQHRRSQFWEHSSLPELKVADQRWRRAATARLETIEGYTRTNGEQYVLGNIIIRERVADIEYAHSKESFEVESYDGLGPIEMVFGRAAFEGRGSREAQFHMKAWESEVISNPLPVFFVTATAHFVDARGNTPGVRLGSDLRVYRCFAPDVFQLAVMHVVAVCRDWGYYLVFAYGEAIGDRATMDGRVGILRVPINLVGVELKSYHDDLDLDPYNIAWSELAMGRNFDVAIAFPEHHLYAVDDCVTFAVPNPFPDPDCFVLRDGDDVIYTPVHRVPDGSAIVFREREDDVGLEEEASSTVSLPPADDPTTHVGLLPFTDIEYFISPHGRDIPRAVFHRQFPSNVAAIVLTRREVEGATREGTNGATLPPSTEIPVVCTLPAPVLDVLRFILDDLTDTSSDSDAVQRSLDGLETELVFEEYEVSDTESEEVAGRELPLVLKGDSGNEKGSEDN